MLLRCLRSGTSRTRPCRLRVRRRGESVVPRNIGTKVALKRRLSEALRWNHNIHYFPCCWRVIGPGTRSALDVGCGDGILARRLATCVGQVVAIDSDVAQIELASRLSSTIATGSRIEFVNADVTTPPFGRRFEAVVTVATIHHLPTQAAFHRLADLIEPGGVLAIEGLARSSRPTDFARDTIAAIVSQILRRSSGRRFHRHSAPIVRPPPDTYRELQDISAETLPGHRNQRHPLAILPWPLPSGGCARTS